MSQHTDPFHENESAASSNPLGKPLGDPLPKPFGNHPANLPENDPLEALSRGLSQWERELLTQPRSPSRPRNA